MVLCWHCEKTVFKNRAVLINAFFQNSPVIFAICKDSQLDNLGDKSAKFATTAHNTSQKPLRLQGIKRIWKINECEIFSGIAALAWRDEWQSCQPGPNALTLAAGHSYCWALIGLRLLDPTVYINVKSNEWQEANLSEFTLCYVSVRLG